MIDIANSDAFSEVEMAAGLRKIPYKPQRLGPGGLALFDEKATDKLVIGIEEIEGQLSLIPDTPRGAPGDYLADNKRKMRFFAARHLRRNAKIFADEIQGIREFNAERQLITLESKRQEKLAQLQAMHEVTWEYRRWGALMGKIYDSDGTTLLLDCFAAFEVQQQTKDFVLSVSATNVRLTAEGVADLIDNVLGATTYTSIHVLCGANFYDALVNHAYVMEALQFSDAARLLLDQRGGFQIGPLFFERSKRMRVKNNVGTMIDFIDTNLAYAFPVGATLENGESLFIGRWAPQPFLSTVNTVDHPPLVVKVVPDPADQFIDMIGISCPLYLCARPDAVIKLTKS